MVRTFLFFLICMSLLTYGQELSEFQRNYSDINTRGMYILSGWSVLNIGVGLTQWNRSALTERYFFRMNTYWNAVNLGIGALGYFAAREGLAGMSLSESIDQQAFMTKLLMTNAALDVGYMLGGLYLIERSKNMSSNQQRFKGFGQSVILQGGFLLVFDLILHYYNQQNLERIINLVQLNISANQAAMTIRF